MALFRNSVIIVFLAVGLVFLIPSSFNAANLEASLKGQVALVTGGSRGIGKGLAVGLGEAGATVYITGRTLSKGDANNGGANGKSQVGSLEETCDLVVKAGGKCIPVACDSGKDEQLEQLFERIIKEQGKIDILVNNAFSAVSWMPQHIGKPFWEKGIDAWDQVNHVGLRSHYVASVYAAQHMTKAKRGLIVNVGSFGGSNYIFDVSYGIGKAAMDRMANDMAVELATDDVTMVSLWPGLVKTENVEDGVLGGLKERRGLQPGTPNIDFNILLPTPLSETPLFSGRAVAAFARDKLKMQQTGKILIPPILAAGYGLVDERGVRSPPMTSLKFIVSLLLQPVLKKLEIWEVTGRLFHANQELSANTKLYWNTLPDLPIPGFLLKLGAGAPNL